MCMLADLRTGLFLMCCVSSFFMCMLADLRTGLFLMCCVSSFVYVHVG